MDTLPCLIHLQGEGMCNTNSSVLSQTKKILKKKKNDEEEARHFFVCFVLFYLFFFFLWKTVCVSNVKIGGLGSIVLT